MSSEFSSDKHSIEGTHYEQASKAYTSKLPAVTEHVEGNVQLLDSDGKIRLVPTPSASPNDPLNWSKWVKFGVYVNAIWFSTMALSIVGGFGALAPYFFGLYIPMGISPDRVSRLITWPSLFTGLGNWAFMPLSLAFGRRPVFLTAALMLVASSAWAAMSGSSFNSHFAARLVQGFSAGATESLLPLVITDLTFIHQRSAAFGIYWTLQNIGTAVFNTASSFEAINLKWQWYYWIFTIFSAVGAVGAFFFFPETKFARAPFAIDGQLTRVDEYGNLVVLTDEEAKVVAVALDQERIVGNGEKKASYLSTLSPMQKPDRNALQIMGQCYVDMAKALLNPAILWALGASAVRLGFNIATSLSFATVLGKEFGWASANTGLVYLGTIPAAFFSYLVTGWGGDRITLWLAKRNGGVHLPEHRLPALIFPVITGLAASLMYGFVAEAGSKVHWFALVFAFNYCIFYFVSVLVTTTSYAVEAMTHRAGAAIVMVIGGKNLIAFGTSTAIVPLVNSGRYAYGYGILTAAEAGWMLLGIPLYFLMPRMRAWLQSRGI